jgi:transposase InsO family protein
MGSRGDCYDNAVAESFSATLKKELIHGRSWPSRRPSSELRSSSTSRSSSTAAAPGTHARLSLARAVRDDHPTKIEKITTTAAAVA